LMSKRFGRISRLPECDDCMTIFSQGFLGE
jgi:hypothetical protein